MGGKVQSSQSHRAEEQRAVLPLRTGTDARVRRRRALGQGTAGFQVEGDNLLVQAQLVEDAVEGFGVQVQDGDQPGEGRRPAALQPAVAAEERGGRQLGEDERERVFKRSPFLLVLLVAAGRQGHHDGAVLGRLGDEILVDLEEQNRRLSHSCSPAPGPG